MRFGSHSHRDTAKVDGIPHDGRDRLVGVLRGLADRIEGAPLTHISGTLASMTTTAEAMAQLVKRALGSDR